MTFRHFVRVFLDALRRGCLCIAAASAGFACSSCQCSPGDRATGPVSHRAVDAPANLVAAFHLAPPASWWTLGHAWFALIDPSRLTARTSSLETFLTAWLGWSSTMTDHLDLAAPLTGAVIDDGEHLGVVVAIPLRRGASMTDGLTRSLAPRYRTQIVAGSPVVELRPVDAPPPVAMGVLDSYVLIADTPPTMHAAAPYVVRTLPEQGPPKDALELVAPGRTLSAAFARWLRPAWARQKAAWTRQDERERPRHGASAPTLGDPSAALDDIDERITSLLASIADVTTSRAAVRFEDGHAHIRAILDVRDPFPGAAPAADQDACWANETALLDLPEDVTIATWSREALPTRQANAAAHAAVLARLFAGRISDAELRRVAVALTQWSHGRGDQLVAGAALSFASSSEARALYLGGNVADASHLDDGIRRIVALPTLPALTAALAPWTGTLHSGPPLPLPTPSGMRVAIERRGPYLSAAATTRPGFSSAPSDMFDVAWSLDGANFHVAVAADGAGALRRLRDHATRGRLRQDSSVRRAATSMGDDQHLLTGALLLLPLRLRMGRDAASAPVLLAWGHDANHHIVHLDASVEALRATRP